MAWVIKVKQEERKTYGDKIDQETYEKEAAEVRERIRKKNIRNAVISAIAVVLMILYLIFQAGDLFDSFNDSSSHYSEVETQEQIDKINKALNNKQFETQITEDENGNKQIQMKGK